mmetsp:Transcript_36499/g.44592  ORF Transcript_36499/g.44592 Transcript_36499/m.44592 type:complete len:102 (-) Transcript_36499:607-912(-)
MILSSLSKICERNSRLALITLRTSFAFSAQQSMNLGSARKLLCKMKRAWEATRNFVIYSLARLYATSPVTMMFRFEACLIVRRCLAFMSSPFLKNMILTFR